MHSLLKLPQPENAVVIVEGMFGFGQILTSVESSDNQRPGGGSEMAKHAEITAVFGILLYFCDPASLWQRASNENANGLHRQYFRKGADLNAIARPGWACRF
jgi:hypothetical protein